jgi:ribonuclease P protein subunit RPR2
MAKAKAKRAGSGVPQKHLHSRISYLNQAAAYLASVEETSRSLISANHKARQVHSTPVQKSSISMYTQSSNLLSQLRAVSLKSQIRLTPELKHSFCRRCDNPLVPGKTSDTTIINNSWQGGKPWADVLTVTCRFCGAVRSFPIGQKLDREKVIKSVEAQLVVDTVEHSFGKGHG